MGIDEILVTSREDKNKVGGIRRNEMSEARAAFGIDFMSYTNWNRREDKS